MPKQKTARNLLKACSLGDDGSVQQLVNRNPSKSYFEVYDNHHWGPLHHAVVSNKIECVQILLSIKSLNIRARTFEGYTALLLAVDRNVSIDIIRLLVETDVHLINIPNNEEVYPMHEAVKKDAIDIVKLFVETMKGKNVPIHDHIDLDEETSLMLAARNKNFEIIDYLLENTPFDCRRISCHNVNAFTMTAMYKSPLGKEKETIKILERLLPLTFDYDPKTNLMPPELLYSNSLCWSFDNYEIIDWFVQKFYLSDTNEEKPLVERLLNEFKKHSSDYGFYNILFGMHSNVKDVMLYQPTEHFIRLMRWRNVYIHFYEMFLQSHDLYDSVAAVFLPKFKNVHPKIVSKTFFIFFTNVTRFADCLPHTKAQNPLCQQYDRSVCLEFLSKFNILINCGVDLIFQSKSITIYFRNLEPLAQRIFLHELLILLMPFSVQDSADDLISSMIVDMVPINDSKDLIVEQIFTDFCIRKGNELPSKLANLCRTTIRHCVFESNKNGTNKEKLFKLMSLNYPIKIKNYLLYNYTNYYQLE